MTYSYTQISQYLSCPSRYKHRYLDGWKEKDTRAAMLFGRAFEHAVAAYFQRQDAAAVLYREWAAHRDSGLHYSERDSWDRMLQSGVQLLERFAQDDRTRIRQPRRNLQVKFTKPLTGQNHFVAYVDAIGELDGTRCLLEWKTTAATRKNQPGCWPWILSWFAIPGSQASQTWRRWCFVRKRLVEIQYFRTTISNDQREEFGQLVQDSIRRIEGAEFLPHSGIRFPQNPCTSCPYIGLCLGRQDLTEAALVRRPGADDLGWLDELTY